MVELVFQSVKYVELSCLESLITLPVMDPGCDGRDAPPQLFASAPPPGLTSHDQFSARSSEGTIPFFPLKGHCISLPTWE